MRGSKVWVANHIILSLIDTKLYFPINNRPITLYSPKLYQWLWAPRTSAIISSLALYFATPSMEASIAWLDCWLHLMCVRSRRRKDFMVSPSKRAKVKEGQHQSEEIFQHKLELGVECWKWAAAIEIEHACSHPLKRDDHHPITIKGM